MQHRLQPTLSDRATIKRREKVGENAIGEPDYERVTIAEDVPCQFDSASTSFVREETGEHVTRPATVTFGADVDLEEADHVEIEGHSTTYDVVGVDQAVDHRRGVTVSIEVELERID